MYRSIINTEEGKIHQKRLGNRWLRWESARIGGGTRLNDKVLFLPDQRRNIAEATHMAIPEIIAWLREIDDPLAKDMKQAIGRPVIRLIEIGLGYFDAGSLHGNPFPAGGATL